MHKCARFKLKIFVFGASALSVLGCASAQLVQQSACPQLASPSDPRALNFANTVEINASLQTFLTAVRGVLEVSAQAEYLTTTACRRMAMDLGAAQNFVAAGAPDAMRTACAEATQRIKVAISEGGIRFTASEPLCQPNERRLGQCETRCNLADDPSCLVLCAAEAHLYGSCRASRVEVIGGTANQVALVGTVSRNLPWLVHAYRALGRGLQADVAAIAKESVELPRKLRAAQPTELACVGVSAASIATAASRLQDSFLVGEQIIALLGVTAPATISNPQQEAM